MRNASRKILIVDSNNSFRESLGEFIKSLGHEVFEAATGPEAVEKTTSVLPDLIIMDVGLPGMHGDEVTSRLKANRSTRNIPIIIGSSWTTAFNVEERLDRALFAGAAEILYKPFQFPMLRDMMRAHLLA